MTAERPFTLGGSDVRLAARRPGGLVLVAYLDPQGRLCGRYADVPLHTLRRLGTHMADLKRLAAALPLAAFVIDAAPPTAVAPSTAVPAGTHPSLPQRSGGFLHAHHALPEGDR